jgi:hypothetical protein
VQLPPDSPHAGAVLHVPFWQVSPLQQSLFEEQVQPPFGRQVAQNPVMYRSSGPYCLLQTRPEQQAAAPPQTWLCSLQPKSEDGMHVVPPLEAVQTSPLQQSESFVHVLCPDVRQLAQTP